MAGCGSVFTLPFDPLDQHGQCVTQYLLVFLDTRFQRRNSRIDFSALGGRQSRSQRMQLRLPFGEHAFEIARVEFHPTALNRDR